MSNDLLSIKLRRSLIIFLALCLLAIQPVRVRGQNTQPIYNGLPIVDLSWSTDSQLLVFADEVGTGWFTYDLKTQRLTLTTGEWPLQPILTSAEADFLKPIASLTSADSLTPAADQISSKMFLSNHQQFIVYAGKRVEATEAGWLLNIGDLLNKKVIQTSIEVVHPFGDVDDFNILWNKKNTVFVVGATPLNGGPLFIYVWGFQNGSRAQTIELFSLSFAGVTYQPDEVYVLSSNGQQVLMRLLNLKSINATVPLNRLFIWNAAVPNKSRLIEGIDNNNILGAAFAPDDEQQLLIVNAQGLINYALPDHKIRVLDATINSTMYSKVLFSPDSKWLAVVMQAKDGTESVRIVSTGYTALEH
jgi:hypothetical protein